MEEHLLFEYIKKSKCGKCGTTLGDSSIVPVMEMPNMSLVHVTCKSCKTELVATITPTGGSTAVEINTDLGATELGKFLDLGPITNKEMLSLKDNRKSWKSQLKRGNI